MSCAAKLIQTWQYRTSSLGGSLPRRRRGLAFGFRVAMPFPTQCSTKPPGIGSDSLTSKNRGGGVELDHNSTTQKATPASPPLEDRSAFPSKYNSEGLVFGLGSDSSSWDSAEIGSSVVKRYIGDDEERWYMLYYGRSADDAHDSIGLATSSNGICWARGEDRAASSGDVGKVMSCSNDWWAFDTRSVRPSDMVIMSSPMYSSVYWLYYTGYTEEEVHMVNNNKIYKSLPGLACSQDGRNWARIEGDHHSGALLDVGVGTEWDSLFIASPKVVLHSNNDLRMYYHSYDAGKGEFGVGLARSRDGIRWVKLGKIMGASGRRGSFDELGVVNAHVVRQARQGRYLMAYEGVSAGGKRRSIGVAVSEDGLSNWTRIQDQPLLQPVEENGWDNVAVSSPCLVQMEEDEWRLYYKGVGHRGTSGIGMAVSSGTDFTQFRRWQRFHL